MELEIPFQPNPNIQIMVDFPGIEWKLPICIDAMDGYEMIWRPLPGGFSRRFLVLKMLMGCGMTESSHNIIL